MRILHHKFIALLGFVTNICDKYQITYSPNGEQVLSHYIYVIFNFPYKEYIKQQLTQSICKDIISD